MNMTESDISLHAASIDIVYQRNINFISCAERVAILNFFLKVVTKLARPISSHETDNSNVSSIHNINAVWHSDKFTSITLAKLWRNFQYFFSGNAQST